MEAPEKIYIIPRQGGDYAPYWRADSQDGFGIEYTRADAFIEKACSWLENNLQGIVGGSIYVEDFRKYMKGE